VSGQVAFGSEAVINTALLAFGMSGRVFHGPLLHAHPGFRLAGACERSRKSIRDHYPSAQSYAGVEQVLDDPSVELVVVNTPTLTHFEYARKALEHGKHVVVEKAFAGNADEAEQLRDLASERGLKLAVFQNRRWDSDFLSVQDVLQSGQLGDIVEANFAYCRYGPALSPKSHKEVPSPGSGIVKDLGPHVIDQALTLFGMPRQVFADIAITREASRVDDYFDILLLYDDKHVHVRGGYFYRQALPEFTLFGKLGSYHKARADVQEAQLQAGMAPEQAGYGLEPAGSEGRLYTGVAGQRPEVREIPAPRGDWSRFYARMHESLTRGGDVPVSADDGVRVMRIIDAAFESRRRGGLVPV
jgi:predicted dehydrogenase